MKEAKYIIGNSKELLEIFHTNRIPPPNLIISSPPYFDVKNYENNCLQIGYGQKNYDDFLNDVIKVFQDCYDISSEDATFWLIADTFKKNKEVVIFPFDIVNKLKENNQPTWTLRDIIIWDKGKNLPWNSKGNFKNQHEYILFFTKGNDFKFNINRTREILDLKKWWKTYPERYNPDGKAPSNIWNFTTPIRGWGNSNQNHFCPFPFPLIEKIISLCSDENDLVFDPFTGSGSVLAMASQMGRDSVGIDINQDYKNRFIDEVLKGAAGYWINRVKELKDAEVLFKNFKKTNGKLRKLKAASKICEHLNKINKYPFIYFVKDMSKNNFEFVILQNGNVPTVNMNDKELQDLIKQCKVNSIITVVNETEFILKTNGEKTFKYKFDKFFSYTSSCKMGNIVKNSAPFEYMYSDISIKI